MKFDWAFIDKSATFVANDLKRDLYLPLCNEAGMMSAITPFLNGDAKTTNKSFILPPVSIEDLHNTRSSRNFWFYLEGYGLWSASGVSGWQQTEEIKNPQNFERRVEAGLLWHKLIYEDKEAQLSSEILSFVPADENKVELMYVRVKNIGAQNKRLTPTSAIALYGRSAENIRDHRHVISLVNRLIPCEYGVVLKPLIIFDERGHTPNTLEYFVLGADEFSNKPIEKLPLLHDFIGNGNLECPESLIKNEPLSKFQSERTDGQEVIGALRFESFELNPGEEKGFIIIIGVKDESADLNKIYEKYNSKEKIFRALEENKKYWIRKASLIDFHSSLKDFDGLMKWINIQPVLRRIYGCSFLPHHDYGKGGRGWRDLWQDCLALILQDPDEVRDTLINNFAGVRLDGSNATIIGQKPGEFIADRNNIPRVWMDHGCWPFLTTKLYIDQTGDIKILFEEQTYFRDGQIKRSNERDWGWNDDYGLCHKTKSKEIYKGTILEHMLIQHLSAFFNIGEHNIIRLEGADWNDGIDKASKRGESVAFSALYAYNLKEMAKLLEVISDKKPEIELYEEIFILLDNRKSYDDIGYKKNLLNKYFESIYPEITGRKKKIKLKDLSDDLHKKADWLYNFIRKREWVEVDKETGFFNGYYNNDGKNVDGIFAEKVLVDGVRMGLTGQVFTLMSGIATEKQAKALYNASKKYLKEKHGGYKLNTPLGPNQLNFGRLFAFAYGEKENGATFSHMVVMFMNALYKRGLIKEGFEVFESIYNLCINKDKAKIYPGIPEYFTPEGKGMYHYLTGSASWFILTLLSEIYCVKGELGGLLISPKLPDKFFSASNEVSVSLNFSNKKLFIKFKTGSKKKFYHKVEEVKINGIKLPKNFLKGDKLFIPKEKLGCYLTAEENVIEVKV